MVSLAGNAVSCCYATARHFARRGRGARGQGRALRPRGRGLARDVGARCPRGPGAHRHRAAGPGGAGRPVELTATEFEILRELARHPGRVFSREALLRAVRNDSNWLGDETTVTVHIRHLREKLEDRPDEPRYILTVRGAGYTFSEG